MMRPHSIRSVLVGTDLRDASEGTLRGAAELARLAGAELHVVHAYEEPAFGAEGRDLVLLQRDRRAALLAQLDRVFPAGFPVASTKVVVGAPAEEILGRVAEVSADLVVIGPHRMRGIADGLLGSTADRLVRSSRVPCLVLGEPLVRPLRLVLVPSDLTPAARGAVRLALGWADDQRREGGDPAEVVVVHVLAPRGGPQELEDEQRGVRRALQATAEGERERAGIPDVPTSTEVLVGDYTADRILQFADAAAADLLVVGTQGDGLLHRALQGSVSSSVARRSTLPVLLVPPGVWMATGRERVVTVAT